MNWFWQGACKSAGEREWPAPGHDKNHGERHHRMLYSVTEKGWREEKRGSYVFGHMIINLRILWNMLINTKKFLNGVTDLNKICSFNWFTLVYPVHICAAYLYYFQLPG